MPRLPFAETYRELIVYRKARALARDVSELSKTFPPEERRALTDQLRRAARSIGAQIAEAWAKRRYPKHFVAKLTDADGERLETEHWMNVALDCRYVSESLERAQAANCEEIGRMLGSMMDHPERFAPGGSIREEATPIVEFDSSDD